MDFAAGEKENTKTESRVHAGLEGVIKKAETGARLNGRCNILVIKHSFFV